jgi:hypothetical protein
MAYDSALRFNVILWITTIAARAHSHEVFSVVQITRRRTTMAEVPR